MGNLDKAHICGVLERPNISNLCGVVCRHLDSHVTLDNLLGFNNTGNVCTCSAC